jgi:hypothetical protein
MLHPNELQASFARPQVRVPPLNYPETVFPLPRTNEPNFIPLLTFVWDFEPDDGPQRGSFRLYMFPVGGKGLGSNPMRFSILRFEPEEVDVQWGFSHVQSCDKEDIYPQWAGLPTSLVSPEIPRIPLVGARLDALGLLLTFITSIYGVGSPEFRILVEREFLRTSKVASALLLELEPQSAG